MNFDAGKEGANGPIVIIGTGNLAAMTTSAACSLRYQHPFRRIDKANGTAVDIFLLTTKK